MPPYLTPPSVSGDKTKRRIKRGHAGLQSALRRERSSPGNGTRAGARPNGGSALHLQTFSPAGKVCHRLVQRYHLSYETVANMWHGGMVPSPVAIAAHGPPALPRGSVRSGNDSGNSGDV